jgi:polar amino acid transport system substrate-binding protein
MLKKRVLVVLFLVLALALVLSACGGSKGGDVLRVGVDDTYPPMEFKDEKNETVGFDIDMAKEIGKRLGKKVEFVSNDWTGIFRALETDKFDCIISSVSITDERKEKYELTRPYIANAQVIVVKPGDDSIKDPKDLAGKNVGVQIDTTADASAQKFLEEVSFDLTQYDQIIQPFQDMKAGRLEAIIVDEVVASYYVNQQKDDYKLSGVRLEEEPIGICIKKGNTQLLNSIQKALDEMRADGALKAISEKWFGKDLTSNVQ